MIYAYGITQQGTYHIRNNLVCQDAHLIVKCGDTSAIAAVADGLGSEEHSDIASKLAVKTAVEYCADHLSPEGTQEQILEVLRTSFSLAQQTIERTAADNGHTPDQYDTTLSLAALMDDTLYYGQSGDSGILALTAEGTYERVTQQQRDEEGLVFPLCFGEEKWVFGKYPKPVASVLLATDGMFDVFFPVYLRSEPVTLYVALARYLMDPGPLGVEELGETAVQEKIGQYMARIPHAQVNDDKTVAVLINPAVKTAPQPPEYYAEPDWPLLKQRYTEAWRRAAYPHLFGDAPESKESATENMPPKGADTAEKTGILKRLIGRKDRSGERGNKT